MYKKEIDPLNWMLLGLFIGFLVPSVVFGFILSRIEKQPCVSPNEIQVVISGEAYRLK